jgi:hypothetical protein
MIADLIGAVGGFMKSLTAAGAAFLLMGLPAAMPAQKAAVPGQIASASKMALPASFSAEAHAPAVAARPTIAEVRNEKHDRHMNALWAASIAAMAAGTSADAVSSWDKREGNSLLASSNGMFGARGVGIKAGIAAGVLLPQIILRKHKELRTAFVLGNLTEAGVFTGAAIHNFRLSAPQH